MYLFYQLVGFVEFPVSVAGQLAILYELFVM